VLRQSRHARPRTREPRGGNSPRVACTDKWRRIERLRSNRAWLEAYNASRERFAAGDLVAEFPYGTYKMRVQCGVRCARAPD